MKKISLLIGIIFLCKVNAQGELFNKTDADSIFGAVTNNVTVHIDTLKKILGMGQWQVNSFSKGDDIPNPAERFYFRNEGVEVIIANDDKTEQLNKTSVIFKSDAPFYGFSREMLEELVFQSSEGFVHFEVREKPHPLSKGFPKAEAAFIYSITSGQQTLERSDLPCPPYCEDP